MSPTLPDQLVDDVKEILRPHRLTDDLFCEFAQALAGYGGRARAAASRADTNQQIDAVRRLIKTAATLQRDIRRANTVFPIKGTQFLPSHWEPLGPSLQSMIDHLNGWLALLASDAPRRRGPSHDGLGPFRVRVLGALHEAGVPITNPKGPAARVLARLLEEIDRRDGIPPRERLQLSGTQWARWVEDVQFNDAVIADQKRSRLVFGEWCRIRLPVFAREWAAARQGRARKRG